MFSGIPPMAALFTVREVVYSASLIHALVRKNFIGMGCITCRLKPIAAIRL